MQTITLKHIANQVVFIHLDITCWSGRKTLQPEDLGLTREQLPPDELVSLGDKTLIDPAQLQVFTSLRTAARRACREVGVRFLGGFLVPAPKAQPLLDRLDELERRFHSASDTFLDQFDVLVEIWEQAHPRWASLIRSALVPSDYVAARLGFAVQAIRLETPDSAVVNHAGLDRAVGGLADTLFQEIAQQAHEALEKSFLGREQVTQRALRPLTTIRDKLDGLAFLDSRVRPVVTVIKQRLMGIPAQGPIQGCNLEALVGLLAILESPERLKLHGERMLNPSPEDGEVGRELIPKQVTALFEDDETGLNTGAESTAVPETEQAPQLADIFDDDDGCFF